MEPIWTPRRSRASSVSVEEVVEYLPVSQGNGVELLRQGEDDMEVRNGEKLTLPCLDPLFFFQELALGAVPVSTRVIRYLHVAAVLALVHVSPEFRGPADLDSAHGLKLL